MEAAIIRWLLTRLLPGLVLCGLLVFSAWKLWDCAYEKGHDVAALAGDTALLNERNANAEARQKLAAESAKAMEAVQEQAQKQQSRADALSAELETVQSALTRSERLLRLDINKVVSHDNETSDCGYSGIGPDSLQLYARALGYADSGHTSPSSGTGG